MPTKTTTEKNEKSIINELEVTAIATDGRGIAREKDGKVIFLEGALPGEKVVAKVIKENKNFAEAKTEKVLTASEIRQEPPCKYAVRCGGCQLQHIVLSAQRDLKRKWFLETLRRVGQFPPELLMDFESKLELVPAAALAYRQRLRFQVAQGKIGFKSGNSNEIVDLQIPCAIGHNAISEHWSEIRNFFLNYGKNPYQAEISVDSKTTKLSLVLIPQSNKRDTNSLSKSEKIFFANMLQEWRKFSFAYSEECFSIEHTLHPHFLVHKNGFIQGHINATKLYANYIMPYLQRFCEDLSYIHALDLYCGSGPFSFLPNSVAKALGKECHTYAVEGSRAAITSCIQNTKEYNVTPVCADVEKWLGEQARSEVKTTNLIITDPPRAGMGGTIISNLLSIYDAHKPSALITISCSPAAFARDAKAIIDAGFALQSLAVFDTFAQTFHYETIAIFERKHI